MDSGITVLDGPGLAKCEPDEGAITVATTRAQHVCRVATYVHTAGGVLLVAEGYGGDEAEAKAAMRDDMRARIRAGSARGKARVA